MSPSGAGSAIPFLEHRETDYYLKNNSLVDY